MNARTAPYQGSASFGSDPRVVIPPQPAAPGALDKESVHLRNLGLGFSIKAELIVLQVAKDGSE